ncbi:hypothetical protein [Patulibacter defluvii]|uniref:hypothetical protein n=1 Tax=Patulibacter defluvii TaxID=3095358 RepID=UPI002A74EC5B|nr:hypothetical protein [Patulibacter sp. DM4]
MRALRRPPVRLALLLVLAAIAGSALLLLRDDDGDGGGDRPAAAPGARSLAELQPDRIIRRVEAIRGLKLRKRPRFRVVPSREISALIRRQQRQDGEAAVSRDDRVTVAMLKLLRMLPADADLERMQRTLAEDGFLGFYDGSRNEMVIVQRGPRLPPSAESTIAHELVHAIDDQHFGIFRRAQRLQRGGDEDRALAYLSVVEGSAEAVASAYVSRYHVPDRDPGDERQLQRLQKQLPYGQLLMLGFPYAFGQAFVQSLGAPGPAPLVAGAFVARPPRTTAEIIDPSRYAQRARPARVRVHAARLLGPGWVSLTDDDDDDFAAANLLGILVTREADAAAALPLVMAWRGGSYAYLRRRAADGKGCVAPCVSRDAFVGALRMASADDATKLAAAYGRIVARRRGARAAGRGAWMADGGGVAVAARGAQVTIAYAPTAALAQRLARQGATSSAPPAGEGPAPGGGDGGGGPQPRPGDGSGGTLSR